MPMDVGCSSYGIDSETRHLLQHSRAAIYAFLRKCDQHVLSIFKKHQNIDRYLLKI